MQVTYGRVKVLFCFLFAANAAFGLSADIDGSGRVDIGDLVMISTQWLLEDEESDLMGYDSSSVEVSTGLYGYVEAAVGISSVNKTYTDADNRILVPGILSRVHMRLFGTGSSTSTSNKLAILRGVASPYAIVGVIDVTAHLNAAAVARDGLDTNRWEYDTANTYGAVGPVSMVDITSGLPVTVEAGDFLAAYMQADIYVGFQATTSEVLFGNGDELTGATAAVVDGPLATKSFSADVFVDTNENIILIDTFSPVV